MINYEQIYGLLHLGEGGDLLRVFQVLDYKVW